MPLIRMKPPVMYQSRLNEPPLSSTKTVVVAIVASTWKKTSLSTVDTSFCVTVRWRMYLSSTWGTTRKTTR